MTNENDFTCNIAMNIIKECLVVTLPQEFDENLVNSLKKELLNKIVANKPRGVIFDFGSVIYMDSYEYSEITDVVKMAGLLGANSIIVGLQPGVAAALVNMNVDTDGINAFLNLEEGIEYIMADMNNEEENEEEIIEEDLYEDDEE